MTKRSTRRPPRPPRTFLEKWIREDGWIQDELAEELDISRATLAKLVAGQSLPSWKTILRIEFLSGGYVTPDHWKAEALRQFPDLDVYAA
jgi:plasmid maintenance system antidote protein VapI